MDCLRSRNRTQPPLLFCFGCGVLLAWFIFWSVWLLATKLIACLLHCTYAFNACVTREGERLKTLLPPSRIIVTIVLKISWDFGLGTVSRDMPLMQCVAKPSWSRHFRPGDPQSDGPNDGSWGATVLSRKCAGRRSSSNPVVFFASRETC